MSIDRPNAILSVLCRKSLWTHRPRLFISRMVALSYIEQTISDTDQDYSPVAWSQTFPTCHRHSRIMTERGRGGRGGGCLQLQGGIIGPVFICNTPMVLGHVNSLGEQVAIQTNVAELSRRQQWATITTRFAASTCYSVHTHTHTHTYTVYTLYTHTHIHTHTQCTLCTHTAPVTLYTHTHTQCTLCTHTAPVTLYTHTHTHTETHACTFTNRTN